MKTCPKCARSFADGFAYCPQDAAELTLCGRPVSVRGTLDFTFALY